MFERVMKVMREKIRIRQYVITLHAEEEMEIIAKLGPTGKLVVITVYRT